MNKLRAFSSELLTHSVLKLRFIGGLGRLNVGMKIG